MDGTNENTTPQDDNESTTPQDDNESTPADQNTADNNQAQRHKANEEAKGYRLKLRDAKATIEAQTAVIGTLQAEVFATALKEGVDRPSGHETYKDGQMLPVPYRATLFHPEDFARFTGHTPADYFNSDGTMDRERLAADLAELHTERPELFTTPKQHGPKPPRQHLPFLNGTDGHATGHSGALADALR